jgi:hypothetical protein
MEDAIKYKKWLVFHEGYNKMNIHKKQTIIMGIKKECPFFNGHSQG